VPLRASVIIRAKDKADTIERTLRAIRLQTCSAEIVVVDSGSTDGTLDIARRWADQVVEIPAETFTYGKALNVGAAAASGTVHFALSAHCVPPRDDWLEQSLRLYSTDEVAATSQSLRTPKGEPIEDYYLQTLADAVRRPGWGFSNHASSWRASVWQSVPFREDLPACEDKEWSWRVLAAGWTIAYSPQLWVPTVHRRQQGLVELHRRAVREARSMICLGAVRRPTAREALRAWWQGLSELSRYPTWLRRLSPYRLVELEGALTGARAATRTCEFPPAELFCTATFANSYSARPPYSPWG
jgi:rhamnosyltransferase